jgi:hypothetical protein
MPPQPLKLFYPFSPEKFIHISEKSWIVIHSGPEEEVRQLWNLAAETREFTGAKRQLVLVYPGHCPDFVGNTDLHLQTYKAWELLKNAGMVFSAAGFNIVRQMQNTTVPHQIMPFPRALDDQFFRAMIYRHRPVN